MATKKKTAAKKSSKKTAKKAAKKSPARKATKKAAKKATKKRTPSAAFMRPVTPDATLAAVVGSAPLPRTDLTKKIWAYIRKHGLQDTKNKRNINADDKLRAVFGGRSTVNMFEMTKLVSKHVK